MKRVLNGTVVKLEISNLRNEGRSFRRIWISDDFNFYNFRQKRVHEFVHGCQTKLRALTSCAGMACPQIADISSVSSKAKRTMRSLLLHHFHPTSSKKKKKKKEKKTKKKATILSHAGSGRSLWSACQLPARRIEMRSNLFLRVCVCRFKLSTIFHCRWYSYAIHCTYVSRS